MASRIRQLAWSALVVLVGSTLGCDDGASGDETGGAGGNADASPDPDPPGADCVPDEAAWNSTIRPLVAQHCDSCHGATPQFGAPYGLTEYAPLLLGPEGDRPVDRIALRIGDGTMPPPAQPQPGGADRMAIIDWATCGAGGDPGVGPNPGGFEVDRPVLGAPDAPPSGTDFFELRADGFEVDAGTRDHIECFTFAAPIESPRMIRRIETIVDDSRVLHHATVIPGGDVRPAGTHSECDGDMGLNLLYAWAPGQGPLHLDEGGIIIEPGQILTVQIHYNNTAGHADVRDRSGVRVHHGPVAGPIVDQVAFGPVDFEIPPNGVHEITGRCVIPRETRIIASFPHMHEYGAGFRQTVIRADGTEESIITLNGWSFDDQYIYETPLVLYPGDTVETTCRFENPNDFTVFNGNRTQDEMCFNFVYHTPPLPSRYCNVFGDDDGPRRGYAPTECAPDGATGDGIEEVEAEIVEGVPDPVVGGEIIPGHYVIDGLTARVATLDLGFGTLDLEQTEIEAAGQMWIGDARIAVDLMLELELRSDLTGFDQEIELGFSGPPVEADEPNQLAFQATCSTSDDIDFVSLAYDATPDGRLRILVPLVDGVVLELALRPAAPAAD